MLISIRTLNIFAWILFVAALGYLYKGTYTEKFTSLTYLLSNLKTIRPYNPLNQGNGIIFLETSDVLKPSHLVICALESAARVHHDRPVVLFMKSLVNVISEDDQKRVRASYPSLSSLDNIYFLPLNMTEIFTDTPLLSWYLKTNPKSERYWIPVSSDGCRLAVIWKYGGIYMDTDILTFRPVQAVNFLAAESSTYSSSGVFGFSQHHDFVWKCMEDFVRNYNGEVWGQQGPFLLTRMLNTFCPQHNFKAFEDIMCGNITFLNPERFHKLQPSDWRKFFEVWKELPNFDNAYGSHLWNHMNHVNVKNVVLPGSNTLAEHFYKEYCPNTYESLKSKI